MTETQSEFTFERKSGELEKKYEKDCPLFENGFAESSPGNFIMPLNFQHQYKKFLEMEVRPDDVWIVTYPKCGTTWMQEMVWLLSNSLDYGNAKSDINKRFPFMELTAISDYHPDMATEIGDTFETVKNMPSPRFIKTHLLFSFLPKQIWTVKPKILYVVRNPKDVAVSYFHHHRLLEDYQGSFESFVECFMQEKVMYSPYWGNVLHFWKIRDEPNIMFLKYEDMKKDLKKVVSEVGEFLGKPIKEEHLGRLQHHLSFDEMKKNPYVNQEILVPSASTKASADGLKFIRKGQIGDWKNYLKPSQVEQFDKWVEEKLRGTGLSFVDS